MGLCCDKNKIQNQEIVKAAVLRRAAVEDAKIPNSAAHAIFGGGRFYLLEAAFNEINGVSQVVCGYMGGVTPNPNWEMVCSDKTNYAQIVRITFDEHVVPYSMLVQIFLRIHDPTQMFRQGDDIGHRFRSVIFAYNEHQYRAANLIKINLNYFNCFPNPIVTQVVPATTFYEAEPEHQNYFMTHPGDQYCRDVIEPTLVKMRIQFKDKIKKPPEDEEAEFMSPEGVDSGQLRKAVREALLSVNPKFN